MYVYTHTGDEFSQKLQQDADYYGLSALEKEEAIRGAMESRRRAEVAHKMPAHQDGHPAALHSDNRMFEFLQSIESDIQKCQKGVETCGDDLRVLSARVLSWEFSPPPPNLSSSPSPSLEGEQNLGLGCRRRWQRRGRSKSGKSSRWVSINTNTMTHNPSFIHVYPTPPF